LLLALKTPVRFLRHFVSGNTKAKRGRG
jgi:hypothetical protein